VRFLRERLRFFLFLRVRDLRLPPIILSQGQAIYISYLYFGPRTFLPRSFLDVLGISPLAFNEATAVNPIDSPFLNLRNKFLFFLVAL